MAGFAGEPVVAPLAGFAGRRQALALLEETEGRGPLNYAVELASLAVLPTQTGDRVAESLDLQRRSTRTWEAALGKEHPSLVVPLNNLATTYVKVGRFTEASSTYQRAIDICGKTLGEDHLDYALLLENHAVVLKKLGQKREAKRVEAQGLQIQRTAERRNGGGSTIGVTALRSHAAMR